MNSFNPHLKDSESTIRNKLKDLLTELRGFKFVTALVVEFDKDELMLQQNTPSFVLTQRQKQLLMKPTLMILFELMYTAIISNIQNILKKACIGLLIQ